MTILTIMFSLQFIVQQTQRFFIALHGENQHLLLKWGNFHMETISSTCLNRASQVLITHGLFALLWQLGLSESQKIKTHLCYVYAIRKALYTAKKFKHNWASSLIFTILSLVYVDSHEEVIVLLLCRKQNALLRC